MAGANRFPLQYLDVYVAARELEDPLQLRTTPGEEGTAYDLLRARLEVDPHRVGLPTARRVRYSYGPRNRSPSKWMRWVDDSATQTSDSQEMSPR